MKLEDFEETTNAIEIRKNIISALYQLDKYDSYVGVDAISEIEKSGYSVVVSKHSDGSGLIADLTGCYVRDELVEAMKSVLAEKLQQVNYHLENLGVSINRD